MDPIAMAEIEKARTDKLPVWARDKMARLERDVEHYQSRIAELLAPEGEATVTRGSFPEVPVGSRGDTFRFYLPPERDQRPDYFEASLDPRGRLHVRGNHAISVHPDVSNVVHIALDRN